jgi:hypothetical protein
MTKASVFDCYLDRETWRIVEIKHWTGTFYLFSLLSEALPRPMVVRAVTRRFGVFIAKMVAKGRSSGRVDGAPHGFGG